MLHSSGIGTYLQNIIPKIKKTHNMILIGKKDDIKRYNWGSDIKIVDTNSKFYSVKEQFELPFKIPKCDLFWSPHYNVPILPIKAKKRLVTIHDVFHLAFYDKLTLPQKFYAKVVIRAATTLSDKIITVSEFSKSEIVKYTGVDPNKIKVINNGIDTEKFSLINNQVLLKNIKQKYNLPEKYLLFVGNVKPHKNLKRLIKAFGLLKNEKMLEGYHLLIVGKKEGFIISDKEIENLIKKLSLEAFIKFTGFVADDDLPAIYNLASALVFPSFYEGFGFPPLESMACGCPVISANIASLPEVCGDAVLYCNPLSPQDIADKIKIIINNPSLKDELINKGYKQARKFSWEICAQETIEVINKVSEN